MRTGGTTAEARQEFRAELARLNLQRLFWVIIAAFATRVALLTMSLAAPGHDQTLVPMLWGDVILSPLLLLLVLGMRRASVAPRFRWLLVFFFAASVLRSAIAQALFAVNGPGDPAIYVFGVMIVGAVFVWPPRFFVPMLAAADALFAALMLSEHDAWLGRFFTVVDLTLWAAFVGVVSWLLYRAKWEDFCRRREIKATATALAQRNAELDELMAIVAHDLRSPLGSLKLTLQHGRTLGSSPPLRRTLGAAADLCDHLLAIAKRLLDTHALDDRCRTNRPPPLDLPRACADAIDRIASQAAERSIAVKLAVASDSNHATVAAEPTALARVIDNLLANAVQHSPAHATVTLTLQDGDEHWTIDVRDEGPGVPEADRETIFRKFRRGRDADGGNGNVGLGLFIATKLTRAMNGRLSCRPPAAGTRGAVFRLELPQSSAAP